MSTYVGRRPEDAGTAEEFAYLTRVQEQVAREEARLAEQKVRWAKEDAEREREQARLREERRKEAAEAFKSELRERFMSANEGATLTDFERIFPSMRDEEMKRRAQTGQSRELEALRQRFGGL